MERIEPESRLCVVQFGECLHHKPEVGEFVGERTALAAAGVLEVFALAHHDGAGMFDVGFQEKMTVLRIMLTVAVEGDGVFEAELHRFAESASERVPLALVAVVGVFHNCDIVDGVQDFAGGVGAAVVDNDYVVALSEAAHHHVADALFVVIDRNYDAYPPVFEKFLSFLHIGEVIIKPTLSSHGNGVKKLHIHNGMVDEKGTSLKDLLVKYKKDYLIQDLVKQHPDMNALNPDSINTIRIVTYRQGMDVYVLYAAIRIGRKGQQIDNESAGGISTKINMDGTLSKFAYGAPGQDKIETTDSGVRLDGYQVPSFEKALAVVKEQHLNLPFQDLVGWDICIDENGDPVMLEWNTTPELSQSAVGPAFGDYTEMVVKDAMSRPNSRMGDPTYRMLEPVSFRNMIRYFFHKK